jgi:hypothetical protein
MARTTTRAKYMKSMVNVKYTQKYCTKQLHVRSEHEAGQEFKILSICEANLMYFETLLAEIMHRNGQVKCAVHDRPLYQLSIIRTTYG